MARDVLRDFPELLQVPLQLDPRAFLALQLAVQALDVGLPTHLGETVLLPRDDLRYRGQLRGLRDLAHGDVLLYGHRRNLHCLGWLGFRDFLFWLGFLRLLRHLFCWLLLLLIGCRCCLLLLEIDDPVNDLTELLLAQVI